MAEATSAPSAASASTETSPEAWGLLVAISLLDSFLDFLFLLRGLLLIDSSENYCRSIFRLSYLDERVVV